MPSLHHAPHTLNAHVIVLIAAAFPIIGPAVYAQPRTGATEPAAAEAQWNRELLASGRVEQVALTMAQANRAAHESVDGSVIGRIRQSLPSLDQFGSTLKYGGFVAVSSQGPEVVALIRSVPMREGKARNGVLARLLDFSRQGVPEAQNFSGFVHEYGLFGAPRNLALARQYYAAAASRHYQPAIFNLATMAYFGKGQAADPNAAREMILQAVGIGPESSGRVCGLASFIEYRSGDREAALRLGQHCYSALAHVPNAAFDTRLPLPQRIKMLRDSIGTGAPDGYHWLAVITRQIQPDTAYVHCKYRLVNELRNHPAADDVRTLARSCYASSTGAPARRDADAAIQGIASFAVTERRALEHLRQTDRFHHAWSVPYLPFRQGDVDLYAPVMKDVK